MSSQWRSELMRNVAEQSTLGHDQRFNPLGHLIEIATKVANFITPPQQTVLYSDTQIAVSQLLSNASQFFHRRREIPGQPVAEDAAHEDNRQQVTRNCEQGKVETGSGDSEQSAAERRILSHEHIYRTTWRPGGDGI